MGKRVIYLLCTLVMCITLCLPAAASFDPNRSCSLTLSYSRNGEACADLDIRIYRVAELCEDGTYELVPPFSQQPINIYGITSQQEWKEIAQTVHNCVSANQIPPYRTQTTAADGNVRFTGLETGLYMVEGTTAQCGNASVMFQDFMIYLPTPNGEDYEYDVTAKPKYTEYTPPASYTVIKVWKDGDKPDSRPKSVTVDILKDSAVQETVKLDSGNNWCYTWEAADDGSVWTVMETDVPAGYKLTITNNEGTFVITNAKTPTTPNIPQTGDTAPVVLYAVLLCVSGFGLVMLSILWMRNRNDEKKR